MIRVRRIPKRIMIRYSYKEIRRLSHASTTTANTEDTSMLIPTPLKFTNRQLRLQYSSIGSDFIRLALYRRFKELLRDESGALIKAAVHDLSAFLRKELPKKDSILHCEMKKSLTNESSRLELMIPLGSGTKTSESIREWLYAAFGFLTEECSEEEANKIVDNIIEIYINERNSNINTLFNRNVVLSERDEFTMRAFNEYIEKVKVRDDLLYESDSRYISFREVFDQKIYLPDLPKIHDRELLVKGLMHKEFYRMMLNPEHQFAQTMTTGGYDLDFRNYGIVRKELSVLDGLGDFYLSLEASRITYLLCRSNGRQVTQNAYRSLKIILGTNTLMSKLTKAYNLHIGLGDPIIMNQLKTEWVPYTMTGKMPDYQSLDETRIYEEEFMADFFEIYAGALLKEQPEVAKKFIHEIFYEILKVISESLPPDIPYGIWSSMIIGREIRGRGFRESDIE